MKLTGKTIATLVAAGVEDLEYYVPLIRLQEEGATVLSAGLDLKPVIGKNGLVITPDTTIASLKAEDLFGLIIPGGWAPDKLRRYPVVTDLVRQMDDAKKPIGIICHGGLIAISAGIVKGHRVTGSLGIKDDLVNAGDRINLKLQWGHAWIGVGINIEEFPSRDGASFNGATPG